ncbi:MAG: deoxyribodipyrimidine photo-lyase, partial [Pseudomonadota bacterium]
MRALSVFWFRRDLRLADHPGLVAAAEGPVVPVFILDPETEALGAAHLWRLGEGLAALAAALEAKGSRLILRRGPALETLRALVAETGAGAVHWSRLYDPAAIARDTAVKAGLKSDGLAVESHPGHVLFEPWTVATGQGQFYKVYTPFWRAVHSRDVPEPIGPPRLTAPERWPAGLDLAALSLGRRMNRGAAVVSRHANVGEDAALARLAGFVEDGIASYARDRDRLDRSGTSNLSENLALGEISPATCWHAG